MNQYNLKSAYAVLLISCLNLFSFLTLFWLRSFDDNRLTSWRWIFIQVDVVPIFSILIFGFGLAYILSKSDYLDRNPMFLFLSSFFTAAIFWQEPEVIVDASRYFTQAKHLKIYGIGYFLQEWGRDITAWTDLPLVPFLYGLIFKFFGELRSYIQIFTTLLFALTVVLTYMIGKSLWNEDTGFAGGLLLLGIPYLFSQIPLMLVDIPAMFFLTFSIFTMIKALGHGGMKWTMTSSIALFLTFLSKYSTWLWLSALLIVFFVFLREAPRKTIKRSGVIALLSLILVGFAILFNYEVITDQIRLLMSYQRPGLRRWGESFTSTFFFQIHPFITISALYSFYVAFKKRDLKQGIISYLILAVLVLQIKRIRYIVPLFPMITLMASYGLQDLQNKENRRFVAFCIVITSLTLAFFVYLPFLQKISTVNLKNAGKFINSLDNPHVEVFTLPQKGSVINPAISVPLLDLYTNKIISYYPTFDAPANWDRIKTSSLRFTWDYINPNYYLMKNEDSRKPKPVIVISQDPNQPLPGYIERRINEHNNLKTFTSTSGVFRYRTVVSVYYD